MNNMFPTQYLDKIVCADSLKILKTLPDNCVDIIFTSPPYNFDMEYSEYKDRKNWDIYFNGLFIIFDECIRILKHGGRIIINVQPNFSDYMPTHHLISKYFLDKELIWKGEILWEKNHYNCKPTAWGSWQSPSAPYLKYTWEFLEVFCKGSIKKEGDRDNIDISDTEFKKYVNAKWSVAPEKNMQEYNHPAMFPPQLVERVLKLFSYRGDIVVDPFNGAGTTTLVCTQHHRHFLGIDISKEYCNTAEERIKTAQIELQLS